jgi:hypothetical protein
MSRGKRWTREELTIVFNLYCKLPFGQLDHRTPGVIELAKLLGRTPSSVAMKLCNFASFDPALQVRGIKGLKAASRTDREVWDEFHADWARLAAESEEAVRAIIGEYKDDERADLEIDTLHVPLKERKQPGGPTEAQQIITVRRGQDFFRATVLASYRFRCAVTGNPAPELLIASHILPWAKFPTERVNPCNGICLSAHFDRAFDKGLVSFDENLRLTLSPALLKYLPNEALEREFISMEGRPLYLPDKFLPDPKFLRYHREQIYRGR